MSTPVVQRDDGQVGPGWDRDPSRRFYVGKVSLKTGLIAAERQETRERTTARHIYSMTGFWLASSGLTFGDAESSRLCDRDRCGRCAVCKLTPHLSPRF